jgi:hypothetical protein
MALRSDPIESRVEEVHRRVAERIARDPSIIAEAARTLHRWLEGEPTTAHPVLLEWKAVLDILTPSEIAEFLVSPSPRARRLRASSPFMTPGH